jgi:ADP-ribose pyrophosphatase YjhB (NUDIX family)
MSARRPLLALLRAYAALPLDAHEASMVAAIIAFVEANPRCAERSLAEGHLTGSAWIVDATRRRALLTHHRKLGLWLQLGGHADGGLDLREVAWREAREESGLAGVRPLATGIFDVDRHRIPARKDEPEHWHYDVRFLFEADAGEPLVVNRESRELAWVPLKEIAARNPEESLARMVRKTQARFGA